MIYKRIMVAIDGSETSEVALKQAIQLANDQQAMLRIIYVVDENFINYSVAYIDYDALCASCKKEGQIVLDKAVEAVRHAKINYECSLVELKPLEGRIAEKIMAEAKVWPADLLVIGTHGRRGLSHLFLGSVAEGVIRLATIPVLLIRGK